jgi:hypothetical protein
MKIFEAGYLSHQELNINWTVPFNEKDDNNSDINGKTSNQQNVEKSCS